MFTISNLSSIKDIVKLTFLSFSAIIVVSAGINLALYLVKKIIKLLKKVV